MDKINPISLSYSETLNRSSNQVIGNVPAGYKFGWMPEHGLTQSEEIGSNLGSWDHKRDGSVRTGLKLSRLVTVNFNFSQNFSSVISGTGIEQRTMTRDYIAVDDLFQKGLPFPGWSFRLAGVEKWPIIKWVAKSASIDHSYAGKESRSWQFEDVSPVDIDFFKLANFVDDYKDYERSSRINMNFSPLIGFNMSLKKNISLTFRHNRNLALDELPTGLTIRKDHSYTSTASYTHRGGMTIPIPYYGKIKLNNNIPKIFLNVSAKKIHNKRKLKFFKKYIDDYSKLEFLDDNFKVSIITPDKDIIPDAQTLNPAYIVFDNYEIILKWNRSLRFALAVCTLKNKLEDEI